MASTKQIGLPDALPFPNARRLRTRDWPEHCRMAMFRDQFGQDRVRLDPLRDHPLNIDVTIAKFAGMGLVWGSRSPLRSEFCDGSDRLMFSLAGSAVAAQFGQEVELAPGDAIALAGGDKGAFITLSPGPIMTLELPVGSFADLRNQAGDTRLQRIAQNAPALQLLQTYLRSFVKVGGNADPSLLSTATAHIRDLVALVVGQRSDELAVRRGLPAARLLRIKEEICAGLESKISLDDIAARHSISPRYIRSLFEREGTTFTEFVRDERLNRARRILLNDFSQDRLISEVAYSVGFNDLSYFNREFRRKFGCSPRESKASPQASS